MSFVWYLLRLVFYRSSITDSIIIVIFLPLSSCVSLDRSIDNATDLGDYVDDGDTVIFIGLWYLFWCWDRSFWQQTTVPNDDFSDEDDKD